MGLYYLIKHAEIKDCSPTTQLLKYMILQLTTILTPKSIAVNIYLKTLSKIFIIKVFRTIVFIFIVISKTSRPICPPAFFRCL